ncbi:hypothetical protein BH23GEM4_BH23GEM4_22810 [soil metagenome]
MSGSTTQEVRELVHRAHDLEPGERLVLLKGLVPRLVQDLGVVGFSELLLELHTKGQRFEEGAPIRARDPSSVRPPTNPSVDRRPAVSFTWKSHGT